MSSGLSRTVPPGRSATGTHPPGLGQRTVLTLGVDHPGAAAEHGLAPEVGLHEGALAPADLPDDHHVGIGHHALSVEAERVVDERAAEEVAADEHPLVAEPGLGSPTGRRRRDGGSWPRGPGARAAAWRHASPRPTGHAAEQCRVLLAVEATHLEPGLAGSLLERARGRSQLVPRVGGHRDVAGEPELGVPVGELGVPVPPRSPVPSCGGR